MDWTTLITTILAALIPTGGVAALFTVRERKTELTLDNMAKINEQWASCSERTELARASMMRCVRIRCVDRDPPYGTTKLNISDGDNQ